MPNFSIIRKTEPVNTFRAESVKGKFDIQTDVITEKFDGEIPIENFDWKVGVIYGASGTGKSTIAKELFGDDLIYSYEYNSKCVLDDMPKDLPVDIICKTFNSVGFSSPPSWLKPYSVLSNGEKMRVDLARSLLEKKERIVFDEYTSVVDRNVAKIGSLAIRKSILKSEKQFIAVSCHDDILEWLEPDWIFCTDNMSFFKGKVLPDTKDHQLSSKSSNATEENGINLGVIII